MTLAQDLTHNTYNGNDSTTVWDYTYKIWEDSDIEVWLTDPDDIDSEVTSNFTVTDSGGVGGTVEYPVTGDPLPTGWKITLLRAQPNTQEYFDVVNNQPFNAETVEEAFDRTVGQIQQNKYELSLCVKTGITDDPATYLEDCRTAAQAAETAQTAAETAQTAAEVAQTAAEVAEANAEASEIAAAASAAEAELYANFHDLDSENDFNTEDELKWYSVSRDAYNKTEFDKLFSSVNLLPNGNLASWPNGAAAIPQNWSTVGSVSYARQTSLPENIGNDTKTYSVRVTFNGTGYAAASAFIHALPLILTDRTYTLSLYCRAVTTPTTISYYTTGTTPDGSFDVTTSWQRFEFQVSFPAAIRTVGFSATNGDQVRFAFLTLNQGYIPQEYQPSVQDFPLSVTQHQYNDLITPAVSNRTLRNLRAEIGYVEDQVTATGWYTFGPNTFQKQFVEILSINISYENVGTCNAAIQSLRVDNMSLTTFTTLFNVTSISVTGNARVHWQVIGY